jgi:hypothetical protein
MGESADRHLALIGVELEQHRSDVLDRRQQLGQIGVTHIFRIRRRIVGRQRRHADAIARVGLDLHRRALLRRVDFVGHEFAQSDIETELEGAAAVVLARQAEIVIREHLVLAIASRRDDAQNPDRATVGGKRARAVLGIARLNPKPARVVCRMPDQGAKPRRSKCHECPPARRRRCRCDHSV